MDGIVPPTNTFEHELKTQLFCLESKLKKSYEDANYKIMEFVRDAINDIKSREVAMTKELELIHAKTSDYYKEEMKKYYENNKETPAEVRLIENPLSKCDLDYRVDYYTLEAKYALRRFTKIHAPCGVPINKRPSHAGIYTDDAIWLAKQTEEKKEREMSKVEKSQNVKNWLRGVPCVENEELKKIMKEMDTNNGKREHTVSTSSNESFELIEAMDDLELAPRAKIAKKVVMDDKSEVRAIFNEKMNKYVEWLNTKAPSTSNPNLPPPPVPSHFLQKSISPSTSVDNNASSVWPSDLPSPPVPPHFLHNQVSYASSKSSDDSTSSVWPVSIPPPLIPRFEKNFSPEYPMPTTAPFKHFHFLDTIKQIQGSETNFWLAQTEAIESSSKLDEKDEEHVSEEPTMDTYIGKLTEETVGLHNERLGSRRKRQHNPYLTSSQLVGINNSAHRYDEFLKSRLELFLRKTD